jgi:hypothetical protein
MTYNNVIGYAAEAIMEQKQTIWEFQGAVSQRLLIWSGISTVSGIVMSLFGKFGRGIGSQFIGWAVVNAAIAVGGAFFTEQRKLQMATPEAPKEQIKEAGNLQRLLWINAGLDVLYMLGGWLTMRSDKAYRRGMGLGIILQGLFLFVFDIFHALKVPTWPWRGSDPRG